MPPFSYNKYIGISLIEILICISIIGILTCTCLPYIRLMQKKQLSIFKESLLSDIYFARTLAIRKNKPIMICPSMDGKICHGKWPDGWIIKEKNQSAILKTYHSNKKNTLICDGQAHPILFDSLGHTPKNNTFTCHSTSKHLKQKTKFVLWRTGRMRVITYT